MRASYALRLVIFCKPASETPDSTMISFCCIQGSKNSADHKNCPDLNFQTFASSVRQFYLRIRGFLCGRGTGRLNPSRETKFSGTHGDRGIFIFPVQLTTSRIDNLTRLIHTLLYVMTVHMWGENNSSPGFKEKSGRA